jgi:ATP-dependent helicase/nuclease subunit A
MNQPLFQPAYQADGQAVSREAFYAIACDPQRSVVVEACAGAGKTWMLVSRIVRALLDGAQPHEILAITFTRKAAGEMRERLGDWLREFASPALTDAQRAQELVLRGVPARRAAELAPALAALHERVLESGHAVEIRTFHAWFSQLLRAAPLDLLSELGLQPGMALIEELDDHRSDIFRRFHTALLRDHALRAEYALLIAQRGRSQARKWLETALDKRVELELADAAGVLDDSVPSPTANGESPANVLLGQRWRSVFRELALALALGGVKAQDAATGLVMAIEQTDSRAAFQHAWQALFTDKGTPRKQLGKVEALTSVQAELEEVALQLRQHEAHIEHMRMVRLSRVLLAEYAGYKRERGLADMADLERCALALLRDADLSAWVQERLDTRIRHVLIDEFQDTSPLQWHALLSWLSAYAGAGGGQSGQRPPGVFIVGDPKQSIYRFRRAEPRVFTAAREFVREGLGGSWLSCDHTRRNAPEVLAVLNGVFSAAVEQGSYAGFRPHTTEIGTMDGAGSFTLPGVPRPPRAVRAADEAPAPWRDTLTTPRHEPEEVLREQEAQVVARAIHAMVRSGQARPGEVFVLCRKRMSLRLVAQALQGLHVPFSSVEDFALMDAAEVRDLVAVLDVLVSPSHRLSLAHALRSPLFGASDDDLIALAQSATEHGDWWRALTETSHADHPALQRAQSLLLSWQVASSRLPPHDLLDRIVSEGDYRERVAATVPPEQRLAALDAIDALLCQALMLDGARYATPYSLVRALKRRVIKVAAPVQPEAVQLLTIHGAKGLEAKVVFVMDAQPEAPQSDTATLLVEWPVHAEQPTRCAFIYAESRCPPSLAGLMADEVEARRREELNGLYVAMTRARERLLFSHTEPFRAAMGTSWWERVEPLSQPWVMPDSPPSGGSLEPGAAIHLPVLPTWTPAEPAARQPQREADSEASRLGQAVHRVLEWATAGGPADVDSLITAAAGEFAVPAAEVGRIASTILRSPACQRFFGGSALCWSGNEVAVSDAGEVLRIDRLVALTAGAGREWWVLDYKVALQPQAQALYREQLLRYRQVIQALQPGDVVRCALINGAGEVLEVAPV